MIYLLMLRAVLQMYGGGGGEQVTVPNFVKQLRIYTYVYMRE